jgi:hypothetical protein
MEPQRSSPHSQQPDTDPLPWDALAQSISWHLVSLREKYKTVIVSIDCVIIKGPSEFKNSSAGKETAAFITSTLLVYIMSQLSPLSLCFLGRAADPPPPISDILFHNIWQHVSMLASTVRCQWSGGRLLDWGSPTVGCPQLLIQSLYTCASFPLFGTRGRANALVSRDKVNTWKQLFMQNLDRRNTTCDT